MDRIETKEWNEGRITKAKVLLCHLLDDSGSKGSPEGQQLHHQTDILHEHHDILQPHSGWIEHRAPEPHLPHPPRGWVTEGQNMPDSLVLERTHEGVNAH